MFYIGASRCVTSTPKRPAAKARSSDRGVGPPQQCVRRGLRSSGSHHLNAFGLFLACLDIAKLLAGLRPTAKSPSGGSPLVSTGEVTAEGVLSCGGLISMF